MPKIYLSPSTQEFNETVIGESEEYYMNLLADKLVPYLYANGIDFKRNKKTMTARDNIRDSNAGNYDFHLALHSNASPEELKGQLKGTQVYYFPYSISGSTMAGIMEDNFKEIYPNPELVRTIGTTALGEVDRTKAPSVLLETAYHDNFEDATWIAENLDTIAETLGLSLTEYFNIPFVQPSEPKKAIVTTQWGNLNIRNLPNIHSKVLATVPKGAEVTVFGDSGNWARVLYGDTLGFAYNDYLDITK